MALLAVLLIVTVVLGLLALWREARSLDEPVTEHYDDDWAA